MSIYLRSLTVYVHMYSCVVVGGGAAARQACGVRAHGAPPPSAGCHWVRQLAARPIAIDPKAVGPRLTKLAVTDAAVRSGPAPVCVPLGVKPSVGPYSTYLRRGALKAHTVTGRMTPAGRWEQQSQNT